MKYNSIAIGKRIKEERIKVGFKSQGAFAEHMGYAYESRQTVANWEKGKTMPCFEDMLKMCEIFNCELGYLLCEYDCKKRNRTDVQAVTGLSENAIKVLESINKSPYKEALESLSDIIEHKDCCVLFIYINSISTERCSNNSIQILTALQIFLTVYLMKFLIMQKLLPIL